MRGLLTIALLSATTLGGCAKCVSVEGTYNEVWTVTRDALLLEPSMDADAAFWFAGFPCGWGRVCGRSSALKASFWPADDA